MILSNMFAKIRPDIMVMSHNELPNKDICIDLEYSLFLVLSQLLLDQNQYRIFH